MTVARPERGPDERSVFRICPRHGEVFHWREFGPREGAPLICLHGLLAHGMAFRKVAPRLAETRRIIVPDLPGHGRDGTFRSAMMAPRVDALVDWLRALLDVIDAPRVDLLGHSIGALAVFLAARDPGRFPELRRVVLVSPGLQIRVPAWTAHLFARLPTRVARLGVTPLGLRVYEPIQWRRARMSRAEVDAYLTPLRQRRRLRFLVELGTDLMRRPDRLEGLEQIRAPMLLIWGDRDHLLPVATGHRIHATAPDARLAVMRGVGHCPMEDAPIDFARLVEGFL